MPMIPLNINGVIIEFSPNVNKSVDKKVIDALECVENKCGIWACSEKSVYIICK